MAKFNPVTTDSTTLGSGNKQHVLYVQSEETAEKPSIIALDASAAGVRTTYYLWIDSTGDLRIHTALPTDEDSDGTVVGDQAA